MPPPVPVPNAVTRLLLGLIRRYPEWRGRYQVIDLAQALVGLVCGGLLIVVPSEAFHTPIFAFIWPNDVAGGAIGFVWVVAATLLLFSRHNGERWYGTWPTIHTLAALACGWVTAYVGLGSVLGSLSLGLPPLISVVGVLTGLVASANAVVRAFAEVIPPLPPDGAEEAAP